MNDSGAERGSPFEGIGINSVAAVLRAAREERGETLDEVARVTRIGKNYLAAIEAGDLGKLPSQAYTRGFIRLYAAHLALSPEMILAMMDASPTGSVTVTTDSPATPQRPVRSLPPYLRTLIMIAVLTVVLGSAYFLFQQSAPGSSSSQNIRTYSPPADKAVTLPATPLQSPPKSEPATLPTPQPESGEQQGFILRLKAVSDGKIHITIDASVSQDYDLVSGDIVEWKAEDAIRLDLDNAASVEGELDGEKLAPFGAGGSAAHLLLRADGIHKE